MSEFEPGRPQPLSLSQLTQLVGNALRLSPQLRGTWVVAELSDVRMSGGHCYMELVEKNPAGAVVAKIRANIWSSSFARINHAFRTATGRDIASGMKVMVAGRVDHHNVYGISFNITDIDPSYTLGDIERLRREILRRLAAEGVADRNKQLRMPMAPQKIAVISSAGAAGYGDFCRQLEGNSGGYVFYPHLFPAVMQGENTPASVMSALGKISESIDFWDCVVIIRGGGATTDLIGFDNLELARAVATFPRPVIVGIGHERDFNVLDYLANVRCKTPTAVAEYLVDRLRNAESYVVRGVDYISRYARERVSGEQRRISALASMLPTLAGAKVENAKARLDALAAAIPVAADTRLSLARQRLDTRRSEVVSLARARLDVAAAGLQRFPEMLRRSTAAALERQTMRLRRLDDLLGVLSPQATLRRGYTITRINGHAVTSAADLRPGDTLSTEFADGSVTSKI